MLVKVVKIRQSTVELAGASSVPIKVQARLMVFVATVSSNPHSLLPLFFIFAAFASLIVVVTHFVRVDF